MIYYLNLFEVNIMSDVFKGEVNNLNHLVLDFASISDAGSSWGRLFDHKVFLNGEIQFVLREFEVTFPTLAPIF